MGLSASDIKRIKALHQKKFRKETGLFIVEGVKTVTELLGSDYEIEAIYSTGNHDFLTEVDQEKVLSIKETELARISGFKAPNGILAVAKVPIQVEPNWEDKLILALDGVRDPGNLGTIIRTAKWFGINTILCSEDCAELYNQKVVQSTMGALFNVNVCYMSLNEALSNCQKNGHTVMGAAMDGNSIYELNSATKTCLVMGSESHGISTPILELCNQSVTIPNRENVQSVESLNVAIATSIFLSELTRS